MWKSSGPTQKDCNSIKVDLGEIDALRNEPTSAMARACKAKIVRWIINDAETWKQVQKEMQGTNLHTNVGMSFVLNSDVLEKIGLQLVDQQNMHMRGEKVNVVVESSKVGDKFIKRGSGSFESIKTTVKSLEQSDEFMSNIKSILKFCRGSTSSSFSEYGSSEKSPINTRKNSFSTPRSMSLNTYHQISSQNLIPGRRSSPVKDGKMRNVTTKNSKDALQPSDQVHLRAVLQHAVGEAPRESHSKSESALPLIVDGTRRETDYFKMQMSEGTIQDTIRSTSKPSYCAYESSMARTDESEDAALRAKPQVGAAMADRRRDSKKTDRRLRHGSNIILQNFSETNGQKELSSARRRSSSGRKPEMKMLVPISCQATAA